MKFCPLYIRDFEPVEKVGVKGTREKMLSRVNSRRMAPWQERSARREDAEGDRGVGQRAQTAQCKIRP